MKAYYGVDGKIRLFRPLENMKRLNMTAARGCLPVMINLYLPLSIAIIAMYNYFIASG